MPTVTEFQSALRSVAKELQQDEVHLAALGHLVRRKLPQLNPEDYGFRNFTQLLMACETVGHIRFGERPEDRWFVFGGSRSPSNASPNYQIVKRVWDVCVSFDDSERAWLDLMDTKQVETDVEVVQDEPERYLEIPRFGRSRQLALLRDFAAGREYAAALGEIAEAWASDSKEHSALLGALQGLGLRLSWLAYLRQAVDAELQDWAGKHGVPSDSLFSFDKASPGVVRSKAQDVSGVHLSLDEEELRSFLKSAIDEMTAAELGQILIPARLLLKSR